jgi:diguanylate cyclase (GGDEF)-like protein
MDNSGLRETDSIGRWGGEEFLVIGKNIGLDAAYKIAQKLREKVEAYDFQLKSSLTISCGVAEYSLDMKKIDDLIQHADDALYEAKKSGRNRVVTARLSYNKETT